MGDGSRKILIAVDASEASEYAFRWAMEHVVRKGDHVVVLSCAFVPHLFSFGSFAFQDDWKKNMNEVTQKCEENLTKLRIIAEEAGIDVTSETRAGDPREEIPQYAESIHADFLVVGSAGNTREAKLSHKLKEGVRMLTLLEEPHNMGSVSNHVITHCKVPTMVVRKVHGKKYEFSGKDLSYAV
mmetsp:Transcript_15579/g.41950  ORF Transcript_15579/g.41950 Transcript_15579/m.41950 type:complete len:184 (+) Transcript_15579:105-656(+)